MTGMREEENKVRREKRKVTWVWIKGGNMPNPNTGRLNLGDLKFENIKKKLLYLLNFVT